MVAAFPVIKLAALAVRQISKPLAKRIQERAKTHPFLRTSICQPLAQFYHRVEVNFKRRTLNLAKLRDVPKLNEAKATELGAELLGECIIFGIAAITITFEYRRQSNEKRKDKEILELRFQNVENSLQDLDFQIDTIEAKIRSLTRVFHTSTEAVKKEIIKTFDTNGEPENKSSFFNALESAKSSIGISNKG